VSRNLNPGKAAGARVLLVEDHASTAVALKKLLSNRNYQVTAAATLAEAREMTAAEQFDILISDLGLPDGNGCELMGELSRDSSIIGIALSGYGMDEDRKRTVFAGFKIHLVKPVTAEELDRALSLAKRIWNGELLDASEADQALSGP
jgi:CheY-like chemotaxis protein